MKKKNYSKNKYEQIQKILQECNVPINYFFLQHIICFIYLLFSTVISIYSPSYIGNLIDSVQDMQYDKIVFNLIVLISLSIGTLAMNYLQCKRYNFFEAQLNIKARASIMKKVSSADVHFWQKNAIGNVETILDKDIPQFNNFLVADISNCIRNIVSFIGIATYIFCVNIKIGIALLIVVFLFVFIQRVYTYPLNKKLKDLKEKETQTNTYSNDILNNVESYFLIDYVDNAYNLYEKSNRELFQRSFIIKNTYQVSSIIAQSFNVISIIIILCIWILNPSMKLTSGQLVNVILYTQRLYAPLIRIGEIFLKYKSFNILLERLQEIVKIDSVKFGCESIRDIKQLDFINLEKKTGDKKLFDNLNITVKKGEILGITGKNGAGKSTLIKFLRKYDNDYKGKILLNGMDINRFSKDSLLKSISIMPQRVTVTIKDIQEVVMYVKKNDLQDFIDIQKIENDNIYNYTTKSGGELQKISFLKALIRDAQIIVLDEPSASMDLESEMRIGEMIEKIKNDKIIIIITHREYLLSLCDKKLNI